MSDLARALRETVSGRVDTAAPLAPLTTLRVGGSAAVLVEAQSAADVSAVAVVAQAHDAPVLVVGRGSNLLVADTGWDGIALLLGSGLRGAAIHGEDVVAGAAEPMPALAVMVARAGLAGLAFGVAIPGTVGGAVRMNAGAHGGEMRDVLQWADVVRLDRGGVEERIDAEQLGMRYRHTDLPADAVVVRAGLRLAQSGADELEAQMAEMRRWRRENQPLSEPSCGSVFRNPPGDSAGRLVEAAGMKGYRVGGATVSKKHANFITVSDDARAADVYTVICDVQHAVAEQFGVALATEVVLAGFSEATRWTEAGR